MSSGKNKSVRFASQTKRRREEMDNSSSHQGTMDASSAVAAAISTSFLGRVKKKQGSHVNQDELDDIDEWNKEDDGDDNDGADEVGVIPSESELREAKRKRRQRKEQQQQVAVKDLEGERTHIGKDTSLAEEGIEIEPFHMEQERTDGTGYFDGDTFVFRKRDADEEPDAWLDALDKDGAAKTSTSFVETTKSSKQLSAEQKVASMDDLTKEELYSKLLPLVSDTETVAQAVRRFGLLVRQQQQNKRNKRTNNTKKTNLNGTTNEQQHDGSIDFNPNSVAKECLDELTGAANALLFKGDVNIYDTTRNDILKILPQQQQEQVVGIVESQEKIAEQQQHPNSAVHWEYMGNQDNKIHGPFSTQQMLDWTQAGYFVGDQQVQIRSIREEKLSTKDDLLADLLEDGDDDNDEEKQGDRKRSKISVKGEWISSNHVNFLSYLSQK